MNCSSGGIEMPFWVSEWRAALPSFQDGKGGAAGAVDQMIRRCRRRARPSELVVLVQRLTTFTTAFAGPARGGAADARKEFFIV